MTEPALYDDYEDWKQWGGASFMALDAYERAYLDAELDGAAADGAVIDIGFGNGLILAWAKERGQRVLGTELSTTATAAAAERGIEILPTDWEMWPGSLDGQVSLITAFDVLEHLTYDQTRSLLDVAARVLRPGGRLVARFPNGQSPFGRVNQNADYTHVTNLSGPIVRQLIGRRPFDIVRAGDPAVVYRGSIATRPIKMARRLVRRIVERAMKTIFMFDVPLDFNTIVVLQRRA